MKENNTTSNEVKKYNLIVQYDPKCTKVVKATVDEHKIPHSVMTDTFMTIPNLTMEEVENYKALLRPCKVSSSDGTRTYNIRFGAWKYVEKKTINEKKPHTHTNNTPEVAAKAKAERKAKKALEKFKKNEHKDDKKKEQPPVYGRNSKAYNYRHGKSNFKNTYKVTPGTKENNLEKKLRQRAQKACKFIDKQNKKKTLTVAVNSRKKASKPVQKELALAA